MEPLNLFEFEFPLYGITKTFKKIWVEFNVTYIKTNTGIYVLDNKNIDGDTIGKRRLKIKSSELYIPRKIYYNIGQALHAKSNVFMDSNGVVFKYKKTKYVPLTYYKVNDVTRAKDGECILTFSQINFSYKINCRKAYSTEYVGILATDFGFIPYEFSEVYKPPSRRKI